jgi:hypothetical protein
MKGLQCSVLHIILMGVVLLLLSGSLLNARVAPPKLPLNESAGLPGSPVNLSFVSQPDALFADFQYRSSDDAETCLFNHGVWYEDHCNYNGLPMPVEICSDTRCLFNSHFYKILHLNLIFGESIGPVLLEVGAVNTARGVSMLQVSIIQNEARTAIFQTSLGVNINDDAKGVQIAGILNNNKKESYGISAAGLINNGGDVKGLQLAAGMNGSGALQGTQISAGINGSETVQGAQLALLGNIAGKSVTGIQAAGIGNRVEGRLGGIQASLLVNSVGEDVAGIQGSIVVNLAGRLKGVQMGIVNRTYWRMEGAQIGALNIASLQGAEKGAQIGLWNSAERKCLVQLGVSNSCNGRARFQFGLLNMAQDNWIPITILVNFDFN